ncbi:MAG: PfkB family carbohydrate kinase, partial [Crocosphaera sp.]
MISTPHILCLGEILWDYLADQLGQKLDKVTSWTAYPGGAPANVACALMKLGT